MLQAYIRPLLALRSPSHPSFQPRAHIHTLTTTMSSNKKARTHPPYELLYWPEIPGRGEFIRLAFEAAGVSYKDVSNEEKDGMPYHHSSTSSTS